VRVASDLRLDGSGHEVDRRVSVQFHPGTDVVEEQTSIRDTHQPRQDVPEKVQRECLTRVYGRVHRELKRGERVRVNVHLPHIGKEMG
jgi:hypothetical protein